MEGLLILLAGALLFVPFVLPIVALRRTRRVSALEERLRSVEDRLIEMTADHLRLRAAMEAGEEEARPIPVDIPMTPPPPPRPPEAAALDALDALADQARREAAPPVAPALEAAAAADPAPAAPATLDPPAPPMAEAPPRSINWEQWLGSAAPRRSAASSWCSPGSSSSSTPSSMA